MPKMPSLDELMELSALTPRLTDECDEYVFPALFADKVEHVKSLLEKCSDLPDDLVIGRCISWRTDGNRESDSSCAPRCERFEFEPEALVEYPYAAAILQQVVDSGLLKQFQNEVPDTELSSQSATPLKLKYFRKAIKIAAATANNHAKVLATQRISGLYWSLELQGLKHECCDEAAKISFIYKVAGNRKCVCIKELLDFVKDYAGNFENHCGYYFPYRFGDKIHTAFASHDYAYNVSLLKDPNLCEVDFAFIFPEDKHDDDDK